MANVLKKYGISSELAQKMVNAAAAKAAELGVAENVVILDDGGNLKAFTHGIQFHRSYLMVVEAAEIEPATS